MVFFLMAISLLLIAYGYHQPTTKSVVHVKMQTRLKQSFSSIEVDKN